MPDRPATPTDQARTLLRRGLSPDEAAIVTGLHPAYVRKVIQRDAGRDESWNNWRAANPHIVRQWRAKENEARKAARRSNRCIASTAA